MQRRRRPTRAQLEYAYATSAQGAFEIARLDFHALRSDPLRAGECREALERAIAAGERRIAEVLGTDFEAGWREAVAQLRANA